MSDVPATLATVSCRVCGEALSAQQRRCSRCGSPTRGRLPDPLSVTWVDGLLATLLAIVTLAISLPITTMLARELWRRPFVSGGLEAAALISMLNGWLFGLPVATVLWNWRSRIRDDNQSHGMALRDYWQAQVKCLIPPAMITACVFGLYLCFRFFY